MNAPFPSLSYDDASADALRFVEIPDDHLEPTLRRRDFVLLQPVTSFAGEGIYLIRNVLGGLASYRAVAGLKPGAPYIRLWCENQHYSDRFVTPAVFAELVVGKAVMTCRVLDHRLFHLHPIAA